MEAYRGCKCKIAPPCSRLRPPNQRRRLLPSWRRITSMPYHRKVDSPPASCWICLAIPKGNRMAGANRVKEVEAERVKGAEPERGKMQKPIPGVVWLTKKRAR